MSQQLGFLLDVDNTLLDNDALKEELATRIRAALGAEGSELFWTLYEEVRREQNFVDLPLTAHRYAVQSDDQAVEKHLNEILDTLPFASFVYPHVFDTLRHLQALGAVSILSDGDQVFQRKKIERSGLAAAVEDHVLIYAHKEQHLAEVAAFQPVDCAVVVDDKARILAAIKEALGVRVTTVHVLQGHYAQEPLPEGFRADITVPHIGDLRAIDAHRFACEG